MKSEKEILQEKLNAINKKEKEDVIKNNYPEFKKMEGRFFKTKNSYGGGKDWFYYTKILTIKPEYVYDTRGNGVTSYYDGYSFEVYSDGTVVFRNTEQGYVHSLGKEISETEFNTAWDKVMDKINNFK